MYIKEKDSPIRTAASRCVDIDLHCLLKVCFKFMAFSHLNHEDVEILGHKPERLTEKNFEVIA